MLPAPCRAIIGLISDCRTGPPCPPLAICIPCIACPPCACPFEACTSRARIPISRASFCNRFFNVVSSLYSLNESELRKRDSSRRRAICGNFFIHSVGALGFRCCRSFAIDVTFKQAKESNAKTSQIIKVCIMIAHKICIPFCDARLYDHLANTMMADSACLFQTVEELQAVHAPVHGVAHSKAAQKPGRSDVEVFLPGIEDQAAEMDDS